MRRKDREVTDPEKIREIISDCHCCRLGLADEGRVYIVPLNFGFTERDGKYTFYFHGAGEGRKIRLLKKNQYAGFEMDTDYRLEKGEKACDYSALFRSVMGSGKVTFMESVSEKICGLNAIMAHSTGKKDWIFSEKMLKNVCVFRLDVEELSGKEHL